MKFSSVEWHERLASTNSVLLEWVREGRELASGFVVAAHQQTSGRGRYERKWVAPAGKNLTFSFLLETGDQAEKMVSLAMAVALGVAEVLEGFGVEAQTKWPNDVLVGGKKICGILAEGGHGSGNSVVVGVGVNVNMDAGELARVDRPATSLLGEVGVVHEVEDVLERMLVALEKWIERWEQGGFSALKDEWKKRCVGIGEYVSVGEGEDVQKGILDGFGHAGQLRLRRDDGSVSEVWVGDMDAGEI